MEDGVWWIMRNNELQELYRETSILFEIKKGKIKTSRLRVKDVRRKNCYRNILKEDEEE